MQDLIFYLLSVPATLIALSVHEFCHGLAADRMGDPTPRSLGRLTLNPLSHLDPIGAICMVLFRFGWAKPVPINPRNFKDARKGMALVALAGPLSNLLMALIGALLYVVTLKLAMWSAVDGLLSTFILYLALFFDIFHFLNLSLFVFNLIPLPPLDGSRIFYVFLPQKAYFSVMKYEKTIQIVLLVALWLGAFTGLLSTIVTFLSDSIFKLLAIIPFFA